MKIVDFSATMFLLIAVLVGGYFYAEYKRLSLTEDHPRTVKEEKKWHTAKELCSSFECQSKRTE